MMLRLIGGDYPILLTRYKKESIVTDTSTGKFITSIMETLAKNGFPEKKVALPLEKLYESAHSKGVNFNKVLEFLQEKGTFHEKTDEKIIFTDKNPNATSAASPLGGFDMSGLKGMNMGEMMRAASDMMKNLSPDQLSTIKNQISNLSPDQIENMKNMFSGLSEEEKNELAEKAKNLM